MKVVTSCEPEVAPKTTKTQQVPPGTVFRIKGLPTEVSIRLENGIFIELTRNSLAPNAGGYDVEKTFPNARIVLE